MIIRDLLSKIHFEYEALQSTCDKLVSENAVLTARLASFHVGDSSGNNQKDIENGEKDIETLTMGSRQVLWSTEQSHSAKPPEEVSSENGSELSFERRQSDNFARVTSRNSISNNHETSSTLKGKTTQFLRKPWVEGLIGCVVVVNIAVMWISADRRVSDAADAQWIEIADLCFLFVYSVEFGLRWFASGASVFRKQWNQLDIAVIFLDVVCLFMREALNTWQGVNVKMFRLFRLFRLARVVKLFRYTPELQLLISGFTGAMRALGFAAALLWLVMILWAFVFVEFVGPHVKDMAEKGFFDSCPQCQIAYSSIFYAQLTLLQTIVAGDSWGIMAFAVIQEHPITFPVFAGSLISIHLGLLNLIFTVIVDAAHEHRQQDERSVAESKEREYGELFANLLDICQSLDTDQSGDLSVNEFIHGFKDHPTFANKLAALDIAEDELITFFRCCDADRSGRVSYVEFVNALYKLQKQDFKTSLFFLKGYIRDICYKMRYEVSESLTKLSMQVDEERNIAETKEREYADFFADLLELCKTIDTDKSGDLTAHEFIRGFRKEKELANKLATLDIAEDELVTFFEICDTDKSGSVSYVEFVNALYKLQKQDFKTAIFFLKGYVHDIKHTVKFELTESLARLSMQVGGDSKYECCGHASEFETDDEMLCISEEQKKTKPKCFPSNASSRHPA